MNKKWKINNRPIQVVIMNKSFLFLSSWYFFLSFCSLGNCEKKVKTQPSVPEMVSYKLLVQYEGGSSVYNYTREKAKPMLDVGKFPHLVWGRTEGKSAQIKETSLNFNLDPTITPSYPWKMNS